MNLIVFYYEPYYELHGTLNLPFIMKLASYAEWEMVCFYDNRTKTLFEKKYQAPNLKTVHFEELGINDCYRSLYQEYNPAIEDRCQEICQEYNPDKILFFNEFYLFKYFKKYHCKKLYFVRCLSKPLISKIITSDDGSIQAKNALDFELSRYYAEREVIYKADTLIADSRNSQKSAKEYYNRDAILCQGHTNIQMFKTIADPKLDLNEVYYIGRLDWQKGLHRLREPSRYELTIIGENILGQHKPKISNNCHYLGWKSYSEYKDKISPIPFALFPHRWESNGLTVQEALAMGKIVIVQKGAGGIEEFINHGQNGFVYDFSQDAPWEDFLDEIRAKYDIRKISVNARKTLENELYENSIKHLSKTITGTEC